MGDPGSATILAGRTVVAAEVARTRTARRRGLLGRDGIDGVLVLVPCRQVHTIGMRFAIDVAFCAADGRVLRVATMQPGRVSRPVVRARVVLEAEAGAFGCWGLRCGDVVEVREHAGRDS
ncbi:MAG: DUF192 domain-containing protein [Acidimicrobiia bacterium]